MLTAVHSTSHAAFANTLVSYAMAFLITTGLKAQSRGKGQTKHMLFPPSLFPRQS